MSGAYVAKPAVDLPPPEGPPTVDDVPPGWDLDWPFDGGESGLDGSGPHPPGYEPDYSLVMFGTEEIASDGVASVTGTFRDHNTFATNEPSPITWTATVTSSPTRSINLRLSGDTEYASSISSDSAFEIYWGVTPDIEFELTEDDIGGTVVLLGMSAIGGEVVGASIEIAVAVVSEIVITFKYELIGELGDGYYYGGSQIRIVDIPILEFLDGWYGSVFWWVPDYAPDYWDIENKFPEDEIAIETSLESIATNGGTATITISPIREDETYVVNSYINFTDCVAKVTVTITIGEDEYVFVDDEDGAIGVTIEIDSTTLEVTQTGP